MQYILVMLYIHVGLSYTLYQLAPNNTPPPHFTTSAKSKLFQTRKKKPLVKFCHVLNILRLNSICYARLNLYRTELFREYAYSIGLLS